MAYRLNYSDYSTAAEGPPDPERWVGPQGPPGPPGPVGPMGPSGIPGDSVINVLDHGAVGDGTTDDTAAIQTVLNAYAGKATVFVPSTGNPFLTTGLALPSGIDLLLYGTIRLKAASTAAPVSVTGAHNVTIRGNGAIDGNASAQTGAGATLSISTASNVRVSGITLTNAFHWNLNVTQSNNVVVDGVTFTLGANANEFALACNNCWLTNCIFDGTGNGDYAFCFYVAVTNSGAIGNTIANAGVGTASAAPAIGILNDSGSNQPCSNILIADNILHDSAGPGIQVVSNGAASGTHSGIILANNRCYNNNKVGSGGTAGAAIFVDWANNVTISGNQVSDNGNPAGPYYTGIFVGPNARQVNVTDNQIYNIGSGLGPATGGNSNAGVYFQNTPDMLFSGNHFYDRQTTPSMAYSFVGGVGARSAVLNNTFHVPSNGALATDTISLNVLTGGVYAMGPNTVLRPSTPMQFANSAGSGRWFVGAQGTESGGNTGSDFQFIGVADVGGQLGAAVTIKRSTSVVSLAVAPTITTLPTNAANDAAAASAGVPLGGVYRNASALMVRTV